MRELYINDKLIELSDNELIGITYCANNIGELQNRNSSFSNTIKIPITQNNKVAFDWSHLVNSSTDLPYKTLKATYIENGVELVSNGMAIINSIEDGYFNINILSGNSDLTELLGDKTIGELYGLDSFLWRRVDTIASNNRSKPYIYPIIDWRSDSDSFFIKDNIVKCNYLLPCLRIKDVFTKIENYINFSFTGPYIATKDHEDMVITPDYFEYENPPIIKATNGAGGLWKNTLQLPSYYPSQIYVNPVQVNYPKLDTFDLGMAYTDAFHTYFTPPSGVLEYGALRFSSTIRIEWLANSSYQYTWQKDEKRLSVTAEIIDDLDNVICEINYIDNEFVKLNHYREVVVDIITPEDYPFSPLRRYTIRIYVAAEQHPNMSSRLIVGQKKNTTALFVFTQSKRIQLNQRIKYSDIFRMKAKDVLKDILNLRGLIIQTNSYLRTIQINNFDDLIRNKSIAKDWSDKVVSISSLKYTFGKYAQKNYLKFKDSQTIEEDYGNSYFSILNKNLDIDKTAVQIGHPATEQKFKYLGANIPKVAGLDIDQDWHKPQYRLLTLDSQYSSVIYMDKSFTTLVNAKIPFCKFESFTEITPKHYKVLNEILENTKVINATLKLNGKDVSELDFSIPIYLDVPEFSISNYFYINRINDYRKGLTNVELVRL